MRKILAGTIGLGLLTAMVSCTPKKESTENISVTKPKLVVGIVIDQMRNDYLSRFEKRYSEKGFKRLLKDGYYFRENHFNYMPTYTGPGHASVYTGTYPAVHGIIGNDWYDKQQGKMVYCAEDTSVTPVGTALSGFQMSPAKLKTEGLGDMIKIASGFKSKSIGISIKDRGAILPAGSSADAAYWFVGKDEGNFITSSYYMNELPQWVKDFNDAEIAQGYFAEDWTTLYDIASYTESDVDNSPYEHSIGDKELPVFPYDLDAIAGDGGMDILKTTPYGNKLVTEFAKAAVTGENLGKGDHTDFLAISYSSTDYIGHTFGTRAIEIEDTYLRLDGDIEELLAFLDAQVGAGNYLVFLTADHGAAPVPQELKDNGINVDYFDNKGFKQHIAYLVEQEYNSDALIENYSNYQFFLNHDELNSLRISAEEVAEFILREGLKYPGIYGGGTHDMIVEANYSKRPYRELENGFAPTQSGDVGFILQPGWMTYSKKGTTHGSPWGYDTHVPLLFYGTGVPSGTYNGRNNITDITPTVCSLLDIESPNGTTGLVLSFE